MAKSAYLGDYTPDVLSLMGAPDTGNQSALARLVTPNPPSPFSSSEFGGNAGSFLTALGLALMSSPRNAPLANLPNTLPPLLKLQEKRNEQQQQDKWNRLNFGVAKGILAGGSNLGPASYMGDEATGDAPSLSPTGMSAGGAFSKALTNTIAPSEYAPIIQQAAAENNIPPDILTKQIAQESSFNPNAVSPAGAIGISQFMPATALRFGIDPRDPKQAIPAAAKYVAANRDMFGGNLGLALAGYNWGEGNVQKWLQSGADPTAMPAETRSYVANITGKPIDAWLSESAAPSVRSIPTQFAAPQATPIPTQAAVPQQTLAQYGSGPAPEDQLAPSGQAAQAPSTQDVMRAQRLMPTTPAPPSPDTVRGKTSRTDAAMRSYDYWFRSMIAGGFLGEPGKIVSRAAEMQAKMAGQYLTEEQKKRIELKYLPQELAIRNRAAFDAPENNIPFQAEKTAAMTTAKEQATNDALMRSMGITPGSPEAQAWTRAHANDPRPEAVKLTEALVASGAMTQEKADQLLAGSIGGNAPTTEHKNYDDYVKDQTARGLPIISRMEWDLQLKRASKPETIINNVQKPLEVDIAKRFNDQAVAASGAAKTIENMHEARRMIDLGMISGPGADERAFLSRAGELLGIPAERAANLSGFQSAMGEVILATVKQLGSGVSISNADVQFSERMAGGNAALGETSIRRALEIREKIARQVIRKYKARVDRIAETLSPDNAALLRSEVEDPPEYQPPQKTSQSVPSGGQRYKWTPNGIVPE